MNKKIELVGKTEKEASVTVNGERVYTNEEQIFRTFIPLVLKENIVRIEVTGANGRKATITKTFYKR